MNLLFTILLFESISGGELILVLLAVFLLFGPNKIPEIARGLAKGINDIKKATGDIQKEVNKTIDPIKKELQGSVDKFKDDIQKGVNKTVDPLKNDLQNSTDKIKEDNTENTIEKTTGNSISNAQEESKNEIAG
jgi:sec-independent protein translocase protein TatA